MASTRNSSHPVDLTARTSDCLGQFVRPGDRLVAALSGGVDSVLLLYILNKLSPMRGFRLSALHVNHGISPNADQWQAFCEGLCEALGIRLDVKRVVVERSGGESLEAAARRARYDAFDEAEAEWLALAHHRDDQAETLLFNLLRGAGVAGAAAMPAMRAFCGRAELGVLRPLLDASREEIEACAHSESLSWIEDESNADIRYSRNYLRHRIFPLLQERFPGCKAVLARAASHFAESEYLLEELAGIDAGKVLREGRIVASELAKMDSVRARNLMRYVLRRAGLSLPENARLHEIVRQVCHAESDRQLSFDLGDRVLRRYKGEVRLTPHGVAGADREWQGEDVLEWGSTMLRFKATKGAGISREKLACGCIRISPRQGGERFRPDGRRPRRELKKLLQEHAVPPWERDRMPLLWCGDELVWVPGVGIDCAWQCRDGEAGLLPAWEQA
ncbi:MAG: tRNA lysidine(34) synthetase TilS [Rhodocyclales bacterium]|nr:tRNA lysidine(34) synthetase TilS [Rhodocyclales bacterium]